MTLKPCPACNKELSPLATACPHCAHPLDEGWTGKPAKKRLSDKEVGWGTGILIILGALGGIVGVVYLMIVGSSPDDPCGTNGEAMISGYVEAQMAIKRQLKAPSTAEFANAYYVKPVMLHCGTWKINSYVDSQNGFGAQVRTNFMAVVRKKGEGSWLVDELQMK